MKKILILIVVMLSLAGGNSPSVSARRVHHISHRATVTRLYHRAYYDLRHHHSYKLAFNKLYKTEYKYHYSYNYRPKVRHHWYRPFGMRFRF